VQRAQGHVQAALDPIKYGRVISERLAKSGPGNARWQRDLSVSFAKLANVHKRSGEKAKARDY
jgi:hypothetical protein